MTTLPIILVPGFWLGARAWDEVAATLRADAHDVASDRVPEQIAAMVYERHDLHGVLVPAVSPKAAVGEERAHHVLRDPLL